MQDVSEDVSLAMLSGKRPLSPEKSTRSGIIPAVGDVLAGKYRVESILGQGGMGAVVAARHVHLKERVAIKVLLVPGHDRKDFQTRFLREAQVSAKLRNEHIARVIDVAVLEDGTPYMVMEYLDGSDLQKVLRETGPLALPFAIELIVQACEGLAEAHSQGIIHRDLKPANLFLTRRTDGSDLLKLLDFGISKLQEASNTMRGERTETGVLLGSPKYMSPEQLSEASDVDGRGDVWALGVILYELLTATQPFTGSTFAAVCARVLNNVMPPPIRSFRPDVPDALEAAVFRCFAREREQRTPSVAHLAHDLLHAVGSPIAAPRAERIRATLERDGVRSDLSSSNLGTTSGGYAHLAASQVSGPISRDETSGSGRGNNALRTTGTFNGTLVSTGGRRRSSALRKFALPAALVGAVVAGLVVRKLVSDDKPSAAPAPSASAVAHPAPVDVPSATAAAVNAAATTSSTADTSPAETATGRAPSRAPAAWAPRRGPVAAPPAHAGGNATPAPQAAPAPTPEPTKAPARKVDPLDERQ